MGMLLPQEKLLEMLVALRPQHFTRSAAAKRMRQRLNAMLGPQLDAEYGTALNRLLRSPEGHDIIGHVLSTSQH